MSSLQRSESVGQARQRLLAAGEIAAELIGDTLADSWARCLQAGLDPATGAADAPRADTAQLRQARALQRELLDHALPVMAYLHQQCRHTDSVIVLSNPDGLLLEACGEGAFIDRATRLHLSPGASWREADRGTNAVGTALVLGVPTVVTGGEHFLACNGILTCAAAPIAGPRGELLGALNVSGDHRSRHPRTFGLVRAAAQMIENRLFQARHGSDLRLRFHPLAEGIGTLAEGVVAVSHDGCVVGANPAALELLGLQAADLGRTAIDSVMAVRMPVLLDWAERRSEQAMFLAGRGRSGLFVRIERPASTITVPAPVPAVAEPVRQDALSVLDTGDARMRIAITRARRVMDKSIPLLIHGESGVGKELFAQAVHRASARADGPFVAVNCAALPENLIEAELFGYVGGAYTGARREGSPGRLREADGGTLFLDEIGDMPLALQCRLLRVLQERVVQPLGGGRPQAVDFALICATHRQLKEAVEAGSFRADLYYRINGLTLNLPPLRERQDFAGLVAALLAELAPDRSLVLAPAVAQAFSTYRWPGNLRQLANALRTACALLGDDETCIDGSHLPDDLLDALHESPPLATPAPDAHKLQALTEQAIHRAVATANGNMAEAARRLGISRNTLYRHWRRMGH